MKNAGGVGGMDDSSLAGTAILGIKTDLSQSRWICLPLIFIPEGSRLPLTAMLPEDPVLGQGSSGQAYHNRGLLQSPGWSHCRPLQRKTSPRLAATGQVSRDTSRF